MDKIKTHLTTAFMMFVFDFADPSTVDTPMLKIAELFDSQKSADRAKKTLGKEGFRKLLSLYFNQFQRGSRIDYDSLGDTLSRNRKVLIRHLGKDKITFLLLIVTLFRSLEPPPRRLGLLHERIGA